MLNLLDILFLLKKHTTLHIGCHPATWCI